MGSSVIQVGDQVKEVRGRRKECGLHLHLKTGMNFNFHVKKTKNKKKEERGIEGRRENQFRVKD